MKPADCIGFRRRPGRAGPHLQFPGRLRLWLLVICFVGGQLAMLAHGAAHSGAGGDGGEPLHACLLCVGGHDLTGAAPPPAAPMLVAAIAAAALPPAAAAVACARDLLVATARGPPVS